MIRSFQHSAPRRALLTATAGVAVFGLLGCPSHGIIDDGTSISWGPSNQGKLLNPAALPRSGDGYRIPPQWARRGLNYATDELVAMIVGVGQRLSRDAPGTQLGVADLSPRRGGPSPWHRSHQTGRDADFLLFVTSASGEPLALEQMIPFQDDGTALVPGDTPGAERLIRFDVARNWILVRALIENQTAPVQYIFLYAPLAQMLLDHARARGEPAGLVEQASFVLHQPSDSLPHNDHMHVRVFCAATDRVVGCEDRGPLRWEKKGYKYAGLR